MRRQTTLSQGSKLAVAGLIIAAIGISTLFLTNSVSVPAVPIGPILLVIAAAFLALGPWRWTPVAGLLVSLFVLGGAFIARGLFDRLGNVNQLGGFAGTWIQILGLVTAIIGSVMATMQNYQGRSASVSR